VGAERIGVVVAAAALAILLIAERSAAAGRSRFGWLYDVDTLPERSVELETWIFEENGKGPISETTVWWAPVIGITDRLELALPIELAFETGEPMEADHTSLYRFGAEVRWRLASADPADAPVFVPLVRLGVKRVVDERKHVRVEPGVVLGLDLGRVHLGVDLGGAITASNDEFSVEARPGFGVSVALNEDLRVGAEGYLQLKVGGERGRDWVVAGPNLSWTHGRFWLTLALPIGLYQIDAAPRLNWAIAF
jgi:hypothetical protein